MLRLDRVGSVICGVPLVPALERGESESDESFAARKRAAEVLEGVEVDVILCDRPTAIGWNDDHYRWVLRLMDGKPISVEDHRAGRARLREVVAAGVAQLRGVVVGGLDLANVRGEELAKLLDECSMASLLADVARAVRGAQSPTPREKKL